METVKTILRILGYESAADLPINRSYRFERENFTDLVIERVGEHRLSVAHVYTQRADLVRDPEVVFDVAGDEWTPVMFQQDPHVYQQSDSGLPEVADFCEDVWESNLRAQGFIEAALAHEDAVHKEVPDQDAGHTGPG